MNNLPSDKKIILFDGVCNLCQSSVQFIIRHDKKEIFQFVSLQSSLGQDILKHICINTNNIDSVVLYQPGVAYYYKFEAALQIVKNLGGFWHLGTIFRLLPTAIGNWVYDYVAKNRYKWFGKNDSCSMPTANLSQRFLT